MSRTERYTQIERILKACRSIDFDDLRVRLGISRATLYRDIRYLEDRLGVPIRRDKETGRLSLDRQGDIAELPGFWLSAQEIHALLSIQQLLEGIDPGGLLRGHVEPIKQRLLQLLGQGSHSAEEVGKRIRLIAAAPRLCTAEYVQTVADALLARRQLQIDYLTRGSGEQSTRRVSPLRLTHYRDNWYLDAWCHERGALRRFAVDAIKRAKTLDDPAEDLADVSLEKQQTPGYGIFAGSEVQWATLRFTAERARWVASEQWHPDQQGEFLPDGRYQLSVPYSQDHELIMDILKYGADCEVLAPLALRERVIEQLRKSLAAYGLVSHGETGQA